MLCGCVCVCVCVCVYIYTHTHIQVAKKPVKRLVKYTLKCVVSLSVKRYHSGVHCAPNTDDIISHSF
jgi:hypothetical protein